MSIASSRWSDHILLVCVGVGRDIYSFVSYFSKQEQFMEEMPKRLGLNPVSCAVVNVLPLTDESFSVVEASYRDNHRVVET